MGMELSVDFHFCSAHRLPYYDGACSRMHGHNYKLQVVIRGEPEPHQGLVMDFDDINKVVNERVMALCDHKVLNDTIENPTAENIASWVFHRLSGHLPGLFEVRLWEIPTACVVYRGPSGFQ